MYNFELVLPILVFQKLPLVKNGSNTSLENLVTVIQPYCNKVVLYVISLSLPACQDNLNVQLLLSDYAESCAFYSFAFILAELHRDFFIQATNYTSKLSALTVRACWLETGQPQWAAFQERDVKVRGG